MINVSRLLTSLGALERFTNDSLDLRHHSGYLGGFHYNKDLLRAAVANTYLETVGTRSDFIYRIPDIDLDPIIARYKFRWRIETMFHVQDECRINTKSRDIRVRYFLFTYEQLVESVWYLFYREEVSFKKYLIELSEACTVMVNNEERKERTRKQS